MAYFLPVEIPELAPVERVFLRVAGGNRRLAIILSATVVCAAVSLTLYGALRLTGDIPDPVLWAKSGERHGPLDLGPFYFIPAVIFFYGVPVISVAIGLQSAVRHRAPIMVARGLGIGVVSMALTLLILWVTFWLVD